MMSHWIIKRFKLIMGNSLFMASFLAWYIRSVKVFIQRFNLILHLAKETISSTYDMESDRQLASDFICRRGDLTTTEAILCKRIEGLTKERDGLISEERELNMAVKQRKETGKNIRSRLRSVINHPKKIATELTPLDTLEKRKRNVSASLTMLGRQLVTLDQQIIDVRDQQKAEIEERKRSSSSTSSITSCQISLQLVN